MPINQPEPTARYREARLRLYGSAMHLFRTKGFEATTADEIAAKAGLSRATFFNHFGNKSAVLRFFGQDLEEKISEFLAGRKPDTTPLAELQRILLAMSTSAEAQRENLKIVFVHSIEDGAYFTEPTPARIKIFKHVAALIAEAQSRGEARTDLSARALATQLIALYNNAVVSVLFANQTAAAAIDQLWNFALGGLTAAAPCPAKRKKAK